jgi:hypothetical protein
MVRGYPRLNVDKREQRPARPIFPPHRSLAIRSSQASANHPTTTNTSGLSAAFFSSLLERDCAQDLAPMRDSLLESALAPITERTTRFLTAHVR